ncbi:hypothetical protein FRC04_010223 [Tulasnella sp. 424]|nr:hypothetical protein FRC04_010223 [Tulasnella sp. 424]KAG8972073.1 hypothetical protein FRC05_010365 [Tulasnella sp. 425]
MSESVEQAASEDGTVAHRTPDAGKSRLAAELDFILDQLEKENNDEEGLDEEASIEREEEYEDESDEERERWMLFPVNIKWLLLID